MFTFRGGVHPYDGKELSMDAKIEELDSDDIMVFPMLQHLGAVSTPTVKRGDRVLVGQIIGEASGFISANVISSVSGKVKAIEERFIATGIKVNSVVVENDRLFEKIDGYGIERDYSTLTNDEIRTIVKDAGIVGMGGAGFPANVKLMPGDDEDIRYIIVNGAECEPYLTSDYRVMLENTDELIGGVKILLHMFKNAQAYIGVEDNKIEAIKHLQNKIENLDRINICKLKTKYPQGGERMLIYAITKQKIDSKKLPKDAGAIVHNIDTVCAIYRAVAKQIPLHERVVTVSGDLIKRPCNLRVQNGTSVKSILERAEGFISTPFRLISGGPMMGIPMASVDVPATKGISALLALSKKRAANFDSTNCIRCGKCVSVCPEFLAPIFMMEDVEKRDFDMFEKHSGMECIECGSCSYICPARRKLTHNFKLGKATVISNRRKNKR